MRNRLSLLSTAAIALLLAVPAVAQQSRPAGSQPQMSQQDMTFAKEAAVGGMAEVQLGQIAQQNAQDPQVKQFGARMVQDHGKANQELQSIASGQNMQLPQQLDQKHQQLYDRLSRMKGAEFDRAYMQAMTKDHDADVKAFRREAQTSRDPQLKQFAEQTLSVIEQHDKMAHDIDRSMTGSGSSRPPRHHTAR